MSTKFAGGVAEDVCQINWNWLYNYSKNGQTFIDLNSVSEYLDLTQWMRPSWLPATWQTLSSACPSP